MFKEFKFSNFRSFKEEQVLSLEPMNRKEEELDCFNIGKVGKDSILKTAVIFGHNSYGKSNVFKALAKMKKIIKFSANQDFKLDIDNFKLDEDSTNKSSLFEISFILNGVTYRYGFEILKEKVFKEWLYKKKIREVNIFDRNNSLNSSIKLNTSYEKLKKFIEFTREEELFLSSMVRNNEKDEMKEIYDWIIENIIIFSADQIFSGVTSDLFLNKNLEKESILKALQCADLGIEDFEVIEEEENFSGMPSFVEKIIKETFKEKTTSNGKLYKTEEIFKHAIFDKNKKKIGNVDFKILEKESEGTIKFYSILGPVLDALKNGHILFIDELDSKLHHQLTKHIVDLFHNLAINNKNAQLVFNTHDFYLIKENIFRKDQIYFTDKNSCGESSIYSLADFKGIEKKTNILNHYLAGNFGGIGKVELGD